MIDAKIFVARNVAGILSGIFADCREACAPYPDQKLTERQLECLRTLVFLLTGLEQHLRGLEEGKVRTVSISLIPTDEPRASGRTEKEEKR